MRVLNNLKNHQIILSSMWEVLTTKLLSKIAYRYLIFLSISEILYEIVYQRKNKSAHQKNKYKSNSEV